MATGRIGASDLTSGANVTVYTAPTDTYAVASINICNLGNPATSQLELLLFRQIHLQQVNILNLIQRYFPKGVLERTGIVLVPGQKIVCYASQALTFPSLWALKRHSINTIGEG